MAERLSSMMNKPSIPWFEYEDNIYTQAYQEPQKILGISGVGIYDEAEEFPCMDIYYGSGW